MLVGAYPFEDQKESKELKENHSTLCSYIQGFYRMFRLLNLAMMFLFPKGTEKIDMLKLRSACAIGKTTSATTIFKKCRHAKITIRLCRWKEDFWNYNIYKNKATLKSVQI
ncbi:uncharacterized protein [Nicotiana tomentosiformis]|uniref:uncharacterized protein n=1 Tax=Nicotiana tomentosiformis TaxID=4098 RepID=UPI00388C77A1